MTNELITRKATGQTIYAHIINQTGQVYNWTLGAFEAPVNANWTDYDLLMVESGTTGYYRATIPPAPAGLVAGFYDAPLFLQAGGAPAVGDTSIGTIIQINWDGTEIIGLIDVSLVSFPAGAIDFTYTVTDSSTGLPVEGAEVWFSTDAAFANIVWKGDTDAFGVARDVDGNLPRLDVGTYWVRVQRAGYAALDDTEVVS